MAVDTLSLDAIATRANDTLYISGQRDVGHPTSATYTELAVVRFQGATSSLDSASQQQLVKVQNWISAGLITQADVKLMKTFGNQASGAFSFKVPVAGIPDTQLVILASGHEAYTEVIPTLSEWALIIFSVVLLGLMTYYVIRRRQAPVPA